MKHNKLDDNLGPEILDELQDLKENYPKVVELMVTMVPVVDTQPLLLRFGVPLSIIM